MKRSRAVLLLLVGLAPMACTPSPPPAGTAITHVTVIDAAHGVRPDHTVVFDGDEITAVLPSHYEPPPVATTLDGTGRYLIPGLWDMHVHLTYDDAFTEAMPGLFLAHGITSVRDTGGLLRKVGPVVEEMRVPGARAPRVFFSGPLLDGEFVVYDGVSRPEIGVRNATVAEAEARVAELKAAGVDFIKVYEMVTPEVFGALVAAGRRAGLPVAAHVPLSMRASQAGPPVDSMEHLRNVELDCARDAPALQERRLEILGAHDGGPGYELRRGLHGLQRLPAIAAFDEERCQATLASLRSTIQVPTLRLNTMALYPPHERPGWDEALGALPAPAREAWVREAAERRAAAEEPDTTFAEWSLSLVGLMHEAGVPVGAGTDTPIGLSIPGYSLHTELERLVEAGLSPRDALAAATVRPAEFLGLEDEMGTIEAGMRADLVLLEADPLADITNTRGIAAVVSRGEVVVDRR